MVDEKQNFLHELAGTVVDDPACSMTDLNEFINTYFSSMGLPVVESFDFHPLLHHAPHAMDRAQDVIQHAQDAIGHVKNANHHHNLFSILPEILQNNNQQEHLQQVLKQGQVAAATKFGYHLTENEGDFRNATVQLLVGDAATVAKYVIISDDSIAKKTSTIVNNSITNAIIKD